MAKPNFFTALKAKMGFGREFVDDVDRSGFGYGEVTTATSLMGNGVVDARARSTLYQKYQEMGYDPVVSGSLRIHVTAALGGHETSGDLVFIEAKPSAKQDAAALKVVQEISDALTPIFNACATTVAYRGAQFGDAYARLYPVKGKGLLDVDVSEMLLPPLVQPYEQGNHTRVCEIAVGDKMTERLVMDQIARLKMPRMLYTPQPLAIEKAWRVKIAENDPDKLPLMPALVGGSFLAEAETQYNHFLASLQGLVGQRVLDSIDESMFTVETAGMSKEQRQEFMASATGMLKRSKAVADEAVKSGRPFLGRIRHLLPVSNNKQLLQVQGLNAGGGGNGRGGSIGIEDVLFHAKLLTGALGSDLSMLGFSDMLSGGLGEGGFVRTSIQTAERSRTIRVALVEFFNHLIDVHVAYRYGVKYDPAKRPWQINFYGNISSMEAERQRTAMDAANAGLGLAQLFQTLKDSGLDEKSMANFLERTVKLDAEDASMYAKAIAKSKDEGGGDGGGFDGGGFKPQPKLEPAGEDGEPD